MLGAIAKHKNTGLPDGEPPAYANRSKLEVLLGPEIVPKWRAGRCLDFGCGPGIEAVAMAKRGAAHVIGIDIRQKWLQEARVRAAAGGVADRCEFHTTWSEPVKYDRVRRLLRALRRPPRRF